MIEVTNMNAYEERQQEKKERYEGLEAKAERNSEAHYKRVGEISSMIPMGQPILVGYHSEKRHRRDIARMDNGMRKSIEATEKAEHYQRKVKNIENPSAISSDDPEAIRKLKEKLSKMEEKREGYKAFNKKARAAGEDTLDSYVLTNLGGNIRRVKQRIEYLERQKGKEYATVEKNGVTVEHNNELNRIQIFFPEIPAPEVRQRLKSNGFRWSPRAGAWQRQTSDWAYSLAVEFTGEATE